MNKARLLALTAFIILATALGAISASADSVFYNKGLMALKSGDHRTAVSMISKALEFDPGNYRYYNDRGVAYRKAGDIEKALADYSRSLDIRPDYTNALNNRGVVFLQTEKYDNAIQDFTEALKYGGLESVLHTNLGVAYSRKGDNQKAIKEFEAAISSSPTDPRAFLFLAESLEKTGESEKSLKFYQRARTAGIDPTIVAGIERRIAALEKGGTGGTMAQAVQSKIKPSPFEDKKSSDPAQTRGIQLARPIPSPSPEINFQNRGTAARLPESPKPQETKIESAKELERKARLKAVEKFSPASREIYFQGVQFMEQADPAKALIRFEDCSQLEKRARNPYGVAWNSFEIGRVHTRLGDHAKAAGHLDEALKYFTAHKSTDEIILVLIELANNRKAVGQKEKVSQIYAKAIEESNAKGYNNLSTALQDMAAGKPPKQTEQKTVEKKQADQPKTDQQPGADKSVKVVSAGPVRTSPTEEQRKTALDSPKPALSEPKSSVQDARKNVKEIPGAAAPAHNQQSIAGQDYSKLETIGKGPSAGKSEKLQTRLKQEPVKQPTGSQNASAEKQHEKLTFSLKNPIPADQRVPSDSAHRLIASHKKELPGGKSVSDEAGTKTSKPIQNKHLSEKSIQSIKQDLVELKRLRQLGDESNMISVLERIANKYAEAMDYEKALHGLAASIAFRDKIGKRDGLEVVLYQSGAMKEKTGNISGALEDFARCMVLSPESATAKNAAVSARSLVSKMSMDLSVLDALKNFWRSRTGRDNQSETQALYSVARIYEKAEKPQDAINYYERAGASVLADKARVYKKIGKEDLAEQSYAQALEAFKKLDYSRYVNMKY